MIDNIIPLSRVHFNTGPSVIFCLVTPPPPPPDFLEAIGAITVVNAPAQLCEAVPVIDRRDGTVFNHILLVSRPASEKSYCLMEKMMLIR